MSAQSTDVVAAGGDLAAAYPMLPETHSNSLNSSSHVSSAAAIIHPTVVHRSPQPPPHSPAPSGDPGSIRPTVVHRQSVNAHHTTSASFSASHTATSSSASNQTSTSAQPLVQTQQTADPHTVAASHSHSAVDGGHSTAHHTDSHRFSQTSLSDNSAHPTRAHSHSHHIWHAAVAAVAETNQRRNSHASVKRDSHNSAATRRETDEEDVELTCIDLLESLFFCCAMCRPTARVATSPAPARSSMAG